MSGAGGELRVTVLDVWDEIPLRLPPQASVTDLKREALARARVRARPDEYEVKYQGARLEEGGSLADLGLPPNAAVIVLPRRRRPAR